VSKQRTRRQQATQLHATARTAPDAWAGGPGLRCCPTATSSSRGTTTARAASQPGKAASARALHARPALHPAQSSTWQASAASKRTNLDF